MLQKLLAPCKGKWTQKRVGSWGESISCNAMVSFVSRNPWWGIAKINTLGVLLCIWAFIMKKHVKGFQTRPSYEKIAEATIVPRHSRRAGVLVASSPSSAIHAISCKSLTYSSDVVCVRGFLFGFEFLFPQYSFFFLLHSMVTQVRIHVHTLFSHRSMLHHQWLGRVPSATQQDLIANPFQGNHLHLPIHPTPSPDVILEWVISGTRIQTLPCGNIMLPILQSFFFFFFPFFSFFFFFFVFCLLRAAPAAYGTSQARGPIRAVAPGLCQSHSNARSEPCLQPTPQLTSTPDP